MKWLVSSLALFAITAQAAETPPSAASSSTLVSQSPDVGQRASAADSPMDGDTAALLTVPLEEGQAQLWHLFHSGFVVRTAHHVLIFDYWPANKTKEQKPGLAHGRIDPDELVGQSVVVFISHEHHDHWYRKSLDWQRTIKDIHYVVSTEVSDDDENYGPPGVTTLDANAKIRVKGLAIRTLLSTDSGVAFVVEVDGLTIYHSGDHAAWNWDVDAGSDTVFVEQDLAPLRGLEIDIAMHVCDPRLKNSGWGGFFAFARRFQPGLMVPMHLKGNYGTTSRVAALFSELGLPVALWPVKGPGDHIRYPVAAAAAER